MLILTFFFNDKPHNILSVDEDSKSLNETFRTGYAVSIRVKNHLKVVSP